MGPAAVVVLLLLALGGPEAKRTAGKGLGAGVGRNAPWVGTGRPGSTNEKLQAEL